MEDKELINKINFEIYYKDGNKVSDLELKIKTNDEYNDNYNYESFNIYKYDKSKGTVCELSQYTKLDKNYILKANETYVIDIEELSFDSMYYSSAVWQSADRVFINGIELHEYSEGYCMGTKYEGGSSESFSFTISKDEKIEEELEKNEIEETITNSTVQQNSNNVKKENNIFIPIFVLIILLVIVIVSLFIYKNKKYK